MSQWDDHENPTDPYSQPPAAAPKRFNTTPAWGNPNVAPQPGDPYYAEWAAANPGIPESAAAPIGNQVDVYGNPYGAKKVGGDNPGTTAPPAPGPDPLASPLTKQYGETFTPPTPSNIGGPAGVGVTPTFGAPTYTPPPAFKFNAPTADKILSDPYYKLRVQQGSDRLQNWAAARGTLNDSSTAKELEDYGQQEASAEIDKIWNRDWQQQTGEYATNYATQFKDPYDIQFGAANVQNNNNMTGYGTNAAATQHKNDTGYLNAFNLFNSNRDYFSNWQDRTWNKQFQYASA